MRKYEDVITAYTIILLLIGIVGIFQSWSLALTIFNFCLISAVMTIGANIQWGYAGLINFGIMGYTALGGLAVVLVNVPPVKEAWSIGGLSIIFCIVIIFTIIFSIQYVLKKIKKSKKRNYIIASIIIFGLIILRLISAPAFENIESVEPARKHLIPGFSKVKSNALNAGALGVTISGAGPSVIAFCKKSQNLKKIGKSMEKLLSVHFYH